MALKKPGRKLALALVPVVCCWALLGPLAIRYDLTTVFAWGTITSVMYTALILLLLNSESAVTRWLSSRWFLRFATLGYGVYLVHPPVVSYVVIPVARVMLVRWAWPLGFVWPCAIGMVLVSTTAVAYVLYLMVEKPCLWIRDRVAG
jgi:peptidoglycan/LPS O-acetylase OafA/YrhL